jgi:hypothetical protein
MTDADIDVKTMLGQCEQLISGMQAGKFRDSLREIQIYLQRNAEIIDIMERMVSSEDANIAETRATYTMELRSNMVALVKLTGEVKPFPN